MKNVLKISQMTFLAVIILFSSTATYANGDKAIDKARAAVEKAAVDDWETLTKSAKVCIRKNVNMEEALTWLNKSVAINKNTETLELLGDYYVKSNDHKRAVGYYVESMKAGKKYNFHFNTSTLEEKVAKALKQS